MFYIGVNQAVNPVKEGDALHGNSIFAIVCVYLFVVFYSFGWGPVPFILSSECSPNHGMLDALADVNGVQELTNDSLSALPGHGSSVDDTMAI